MEPQTLPIEDTFGDILRKAMRGNHVDRTGLARATGIGTAALDAWLRDDGVADPAQCRALGGALRLDVAKLTGSANADWYPAAIARNDIRRHSQHPHPSNGYVIVRDGGPHAALVDPAGDPRHLLEVLRDGQYELQYILITHKHADHCDAAAEIAAAYPEAAIVMHPLDVHAIGRELAAKALPLTDGGELPFGDGVIGTLHTPGHTDGSSCFYYRCALFSGDTLFAGSVGGAYGDDSTYADILQSVRDKIFSLPLETALMPGHGPAATLQEARAHNPFVSDG